MAKKCYNKTSIENYTGMVLQNSGLASNRLVSAINFFTYGMRTTCPNCGTSYSGSANSWTCPNCGSVYTRGSDARAAYGFAAGTGSTKIIAETTLLPLSAKLSFSNDFTNPWTSRTENPVTQYVSNSAYTYTIYYNGSAAWTFTQISGDTNFTASRVTNGIKINLASWYNYSIQKTKYVFRITAPDADNHLELTIEKKSSTYLTGNTLQFYFENFKCQNNPGIYTTGDARSQCGINAIYRWRGYDTVGVLQDLYAKVSWFQDWDFSGYIYLPIQSEGTARTNSGLYPNVTDGYALKMYIFNMKENYNPKYAGNMSFQVDYGFFDVVDGQLSTYVLQWVSSQGYSLNPYTSHIAAMVPISVLENVPSWQTRGEALIGFSYGAGNTLDEYYFERPNNYLFVISKDDGY